MADYIEREAARAKAVYMYGFGANKYVPLKAVENIPAADVAPVVHGRWLGELGGLTCSVCGCEGPDDGGYWPSPFCPCCGAKMDGGKED